jgi:hypothetical protein
VRCFQTTKKKGTFAVDLNAWGSQTKTAYQLWCAEKWAFDAREVLGEIQKCVSYFADKVVHGKPLQPGFRNCLCTIETSRQLSKNRGGGIGIVCHLPDKPARRALRRAVVVPNDPAPGNRRRVRS